MARKWGVGNAICLEPNACEGVLRDVKGGKGVGPSSAVSTTRAFTVFSLPLSPRPHRRTRLLSFLKTVHG